MAAIAAVDGLVPDKCVRAVAARFQGVEHRIELVRELDGVKYYNDSIGTSPSRTVACLESFPEPVILIAGGYDKGIPFHALALEIRERVKTPGPHRGHGPGHPAGSGGGGGRPRLPGDHSDRGPGRGGGRPPAGRRGRGTWWCCPRLRGLRPLQELHGAGRAFKELVRSL